MVASLPPLACAICDHPITEGALRRRSRCPRCNHRHGLGARHRLLLAHVQRRRIQAAVDRGAADEAAMQGEPGAGGRFVLAVIVAAALPPLLRPIAERIELAGEAWLVIAVGLVVLVAMAAALHVLLGEADPAATTPVRVDGLTVDRAVLDAEAAAWRAGTLRRGIELRRRAHRPVPGVGAALLLAGLGGLLLLAGEGARLGAAILAAAAALGLALVVHRIERRRRREVALARRIAAALGPESAPALHLGPAAIACWAATRWAGALELPDLERAAAISIERGDFEVLAVVTGERYAARPGDLGRLRRPEMVTLLVPFVTPPLAVREADAILGAGIVRDLQAHGWHLAHDPAVGLQATRLAPSEALHFTHEQLVRVSQTMPALLDLAAALGGVPPRALAERELTTLAPAAG